MSYKPILVKKNKIWLWTVVNHWQSGIIAWVLGDRSNQTFQSLWQVIRGWQSFWYVTDGWKVYPCFIDDSDHLVLKTYMTRVEVRNALRRKHLNLIQVNGEGENTRLRHYLASRHSLGFKIRERTRPA